jgi:AraC-like DNA-binding protein
MPTSYGKQHIRSADYDYDGEKRGDRPFAILQYTLSGAGRLEWDGTVRSLLPGDMMILRVPHRHRYYFSPAAADHWEFVFASLIGSEALRIIDSALREHGPIIRLEPDAYVLAEMYELLREVCGRRGDRRDAGEERSSFRHSARAYSLVMALMEALALPDRHRADDPRIRAAKRILHERFHRELSVAALAEEVGMSRSAFTRLFTRTQGMAPVEYLEDLRMQAAVTALRAGEKSVQEIAFACGYRDSHYFSRAFKKRLGRSPSEYRRSVQ